MLTAALISTSISCAEVQFSAARQHWSTAAASAPNPNGLVPGRLIEFSFDSFVEFGRKKLQSHDTGASDDFLRHAGDHVVS